MKCRKIQYNLENFTSGRMSVVSNRRRSLESRRSPKPKVTGSSPAEDSMQRFLSGGQEVYQPMEQSYLRNRAGGS